MSSRKYPVRITRSASGIRSQDLRSLARGLWWAKRWISGLEAMRLGPRLGRGRQYALSGQVTELEMAGPAVNAVIVGSRSEPYRVSLEFAAVGEDGAGRIYQKLKEDPVMLARLLTDDLPIEAESLFREEGVPLFPVGGFLPGTERYDITMRCSCPDWSRPCKHIVAVLFLVGEEVARRPVELLSLRGVDVCGMLPEGDGADSELLSCAPMSRLGPIPFWRGYSKCTETLDLIGTKASAVSLLAAKGESIYLKN